MDAKVAAAVTAAVRDAATVPLMAQRRRRHLLERG